MEWTCYLESYSYLSSRQKVKQSQVLQIINSSKRNYEEIFDGFLRHPQSYLDNYQKNFMLFPDNPVQTSKSFTKTGTERRYHRRAEWRNSQVERTYWNPRRRPKWSEWEIWRSKKETNQFTRGIAEV